MPVTVSTFNSRSMNYPILSTIQFGMRNAENRQGTEMQTPPTQTREEEPSNSTHDVDQPSYGRSLAYALPLSGNPTASHQTDDASAASPSPIVVIQPDDRFTSRHGETAEAWTSPIRPEALQTQPTEQLPPTHEERMPSIRSILVSTLSSTVMMCLSGLSLYLAVRNHSKLSDPVSLPPPPQQNTPSAHARPRQPLEKPGTPGTAAVILLTGFASFLFALGLGGLASSKFIKRRSLQRQLHESEQQAAGNI